MVNHAGFHRRGADDAGRPAGAWPGFGALPGLSLLVVTGCAVPVSDRPLPSASPAATPRALTQTSASRPAQGSAQAAPPGRHASVVRDRPDEDGPTARESPFDDTDDGFDGGGGQTGGSWH